MVGVAVGAVIIKKLTEHVQALVSVSTQLLVADTVWYTDVTAWVSTATLIAFRIFQAVVQQVALCTHAAEMAAVFAINKWFMAVQKAAQWLQVAAVLAT